MDQTKHARLEMHMAEPEPEPNVSSWLETGSMEAPVGKRVKTGSMEAPFGSDVFKEKTNLEYDDSKDKNRPPDEVKDVSQPKSLDPSTTRRKRRGFISFKYNESSDVYEDCFIDDEESGSDVEWTSMLTPEDTYDEEDRTIMLRALSENLKSKERIFKKQYSYGTYGSGDPPTFMIDMMDVMNWIKSGNHDVKIDVRHCITSLTRNAFALPEESTGIKWVGVHTGNDICVATLRDDVDRKRCQLCFVNLSPAGVLSMFRKCALSELQGAGFFSISLEFCLCVCVCVTVAIFAAHLVFSFCFLLMYPEDLVSIYDKSIVLNRLVNGKCIVQADPTSKLCEKLHGCIGGFPFCVVSTPTPVTAETFDESGLVTSSDAVSFIQESDLLEQAKDCGGAIKLAIYAFKRLMSCEAKEIVVIVVSGLTKGRVTIREMVFPEFMQYAEECSASHQESSM